RGAAHAEETQDPFLPPAQGVRSGRRRAERPVPLPGGLAEPREQGPLRASRRRVAGPQPAPAPEQATSSGGTGISVSELILPYYRFAQSYYPADGDTTSEVRSIREALRPVRRLFGDQSAASVGPLALKAVRQAMIDQGWCRTHVNHQVHRVRRMFRWGVSE